MELAKITSKGQITLPIEIRRKLGVKEGDKVMFVEEGGRVYLLNSSLEALKEVQAAFQGVAEQIGVKDEQDIVDLVNEIRRERSGQYECE